MNALERAVLDTNVVSYLLEQSLLGMQYQSLLAGKAACVACVTPEELYFGAARRKWGDRKRRALAALIDDYELLPGTLDIAKISADIRSERARIGRPLDKTDAWIAATAMDHRLPLFSHDKDFDGIEGLRLVTLRSADVEEFRCAGIALEDGALKASPFNFACLGSSVLQ